MEFNEDHLGVEIGLIMEEVEALPVQDHDYVNPNRRGTTGSSTCTSTSITAAPKDDTAQTSTNSRILVKKPNSTSVIWDFFGFEADKNGFAIDNGKPQCRTCYKEIACKTGNTTNLFKHLLDHHPHLHSKAKVRLLHFK
jgi:hypothetical protein